MRSCSTTWDTRQRQHCTFQSWKAHFSVLAVLVSLLPQRVSFSTEQWLSHRRKRFCLLEENRIEGIMTVTRCSSGPVGAPERFCVGCKQQQPSSTGPCGVVLTLLWCATVIHGALRRGAHAALMCNRHPWGPAAWCSRCSDVQSQDSRVGRDLRDNFSQRFTLRLGEFCVS